MTKSGTRRSFFAPTLSTSTTPPLATGSNQSASTSAGNSSSSLNGQAAGVNGVLSNPTSPTGATAQENPFADERPELLKKLSTSFLHEAIPERFFYDELGTEEEKQQLKNRLSKTEFNYHQAGYELYVTEADFVGDMQVMNEVFIEPMEKQFSKELAKSIFTEHFPLLTRLHEALLQSIKSLRDGPFMKHGLGELFLKNANLFQSYSPYFINYPTALHVIEKKKKEKESFATFVRMCEQNPQCRKLKLQSLLIKPIQRVMKYPLLLRELAKSCEDESEKAVLEKAQSRLQEVVGMLNEVQRKAENREKIQEIQSRFHDKKSVSYLTPSPDVNDQDSRFYLEAKVSQIGRDKQEEEQYFLFLFHDNLLLAKKSKSVVKSSSLKFLKSWPLNAIVVNDYENQEALAGALEIGEVENASHRYWFHLGSKKARWLATFEELGVRKNVDLRRVGSLTNIPTLIEEEENWEELFKLEQLKTEQLEEQLQNWEEKYQELLEAHKDENETLVLRADTEKAYQQAMYDEELKSLQAKIQQTESELSSVRRLYEKQASIALESEDKVKQLEAQLQAKEAEIQQAEQEKKKKATKIDADLEAQFSTSKKENEAQRKLNRTLEANIHQLNEEKQALKQQLDKVEGDQREALAQLAELDCQLTASKEELQVTRKREQVAKEGLEKVATSLAASEARIIELTAAQQAPLEELQRTKEDLSTARNREVELLKEIDELNHRVAKITANGEASLQALHEELVHCGDTEAALKTELALAQRLIQETKGELETVSTHSSEENKRLATKVADLESQNQALLAESEANRVRAESAEKQLPELTLEHSRISHARDRSSEDHLQLQAALQTSLTELIERLKSAELLVQEKEAVLEATNQALTSLEGKHSLQLARSQKLEEEVLALKNELQGSLLSQEELQKVSTSAENRYLDEASAATSQILSLEAIAEDLRRRLAEERSHPHAVAPKKKKDGVQIWMATTILLAGLLAGLLGMQVLG